MTDRIIHIFFAFAKDSKQLLDIAKHEVELINNWLSTNMPITLKLHDWQHTGVSNMGNPEKKLMEQMPIGDANIFVAVFRFDYGSPTGNINERTGEKYQSGMEEEFYIAYNLWEKNKTPDIIIMKSEEAIPRTKVTSLDDLTKIEAFFKDFKAQGTHPGLYSTFGSEAEFGEVFRRNIVSRVFDILKNKDGESIPTMGEYYKKVGMLDLFLSEQNEKRNACKTQQIKQSKRLRLCARTGYNFICRMGSFYSIVREALEKGGRFQLIMQNPWSLNAIYAARGDELFRKRFAEFKKGNITADQLLTEYENSHWYRERFLACNDGYNVLKKEFGRNVQLKFSDMDLSNSIFLTDEELYFEPYMNSIQIGARSIPLFEVRASRKAILYQDAERDFEDLWKTSCEFNEFHRNKSGFRIKLRGYLESMAGDEK